MTLVLDTSVVVAILTDEPDAGRMAARLAVDEPRVISAATVFELFVVMLRRGGPGSVQDARDLLATLRPRVAPFDDGAVQAALAAYARYGKGIHPKARLYLVDCAAYALAKSLDAPLLFKGGDFAETDVASALS